MVSAQPCCTFFRNIASVSPQVQRTMLQNIVLQNCRSCSLQNSVFSAGDKYGKFSQSKFKRAQVYYPINSRQNRVPRQTCKVNVNTSSSLNGPILALVNRHQFEAVHSGSVMLWNFRGYSLKSPYPVAYTKRSFSNISKEIISGDGAGAARSCGKNSLFSIFNSNKRHTKSLASLKRAGKEVVALSGALEISPSSTESSSLKGGDMVRSKKQLGNHIDGPKLTPIVSSSPIANVNKDNKSKVKQKQKPRSKKEKVKSVEATSADDAVANLEACESISEVVKTDIDMKGKSRSATVINFVSPKKQSKKGTVKPRRKQSKGEAGAPVKTSGTPTEVISGSVMKQKPMPDANGKSKPLGKKVIPQLYPPIGKSVVVMESATKAKVIQGYLGDMFEVLPSYGHVRDLAARSGSVRPNDGFSMVWEVPSAAWTHLKSIKVALYGAENLILASDPDREGEAIAWHIIEMLQQQDALHDGITVARVVFNEISESSIKSALQVPRDIDANLVQAYLARRALDYLIGFNISPLLWRKLPGCQSAGRVQSAALALISDREMEIDEFKPQEYWSVDVKFERKELGAMANNFCFSSYLTHFDSKKLDHLAITSETSAQEIEQKIKLTSFNVVGCKRSKSRRNPSPPLITSTLQQEAANKLHFSATYTMKLAQKLYEGVVLSDGKAAGLITYMRTDGLYISDDAVKEIRAVVLDRYGQEFVSGTPRKYFKKVKNAQEAHEAIRPTDVHRLPSTLARILDEDSLKLYTLIWARTVACQMEPATIGLVQLDVGNADHSITFRATCSKVDFLGYQAVYKDLETKAIRSYGSEKNDHDEPSQVINNLKTGDSLCLGEVKLNQHHTQPPPRYSEAALVRKLEELGIGRPSTYASTLKVLQDRKYVTMKSRVLYPEFRGRMVSAFLSHHFSEVTDYSFTADMETELDNVSAGMTEWKGLLKDYWTRFSGYCDRAASVHIHQVEKMLEKTFGDHLFSSLPNGSRACPSCLEGKLNFKVSRLGAGYFIGCDQHPKCKYIAKTLYGDEEDDDTPQRSNTVEEPKLLGVHSVSNEKIFLKNGPYGRYVQLGEDRKGYLPKRASASQIKDTNSITLADAIALLQYPVTLGKDPKHNKPVILKLTKNGYAIKNGCTTAPVPKNVKPNDITLEHGLKILMGDDAKHSGRPKKKREAAVEAI